MNIEEIRIWLAIAVALVSISGTVWIWFTRPSRENAETLKEIAAEFSQKIGKHETKLTEHDRRIQHVEAEIEHMPGKDAVHQLEITIEKLRCEVSTISEATRNTANAIKRIEQYLMDQQK